ncbi:unnamed protein product [Urochloa humidicola]
MAKYINHAARWSSVRARRPSSGAACAFAAATAPSFYRCSSCDFRVHDTCAACPETLSFFGHPQHPLALHPLVVGRSCDLCRFCIRGIHYGCRLCGVFLHPVCATLPPAAVSPAHPQHLVTLVPSTGYGYAWKKCASCGDVPLGSTEEGWHYVCAPCGVRLHPWCLLGNGGNKDEGAPLCIRGPV